MTRTQTFLKITYTTIIWAQNDLQFLDLNFLCISKVLALLDYILSLKHRTKLNLQGLNLFDKEKILSKNFITLPTKITVL